MFQNAKEIDNHRKTIDHVIQANSRLNSDVIELINASQGLGMKQEFHQESDEYQLQCSLNLRISEIWSWKWILEDLAKRLEEVVGVLEHEHHAVRVVQERLKEEIFWRSQDVRRPGPLKKVDDVEQALLKEFKMLRDQKKYFENIQSEVENKILYTKKVKRRLIEDLKRKDNTIAVEEACLQLQFKHDKIVKKKRSAPLSRWKNRSEALKRDGLQALHSAFCTRDQIRLARVNLSILAQTDATRVDAALRRRLHGNESKLEELRWQEKESKQDLKTLSEERLSNEKNVLDIIERLRLVEARTEERKHRGPGEVVRDEVDRKLRQEIGTLKRSLRDFNNVIFSIMTLQEATKSCLIQITCCISDLTEVIDLDKSRILSRKTDDEKAQNNAEFSRMIIPKDVQCVQLEVITEENEMPDDEFANN